MTAQFSNYTDKFVKFSTADKELLAAALTFKKADVRAELVVSDRPSSELFFILKGCVRKYYVKDGEQITTNIMTENNFIGAFTSLITGVKSNETIECLEPLEIRRSSFSYQAFRAPFLKRTVTTSRKAVRIRGATTR